MSRWVIVKGALAAAGLAAGLTGMALDQRSLVWVGVGLLGGALVVRFIQRR